jgi:nitrogen-specific signal transduction histidine kinase
MSSATVEMKGKLKPVPSLLSKLPKWLRWTSLALLIILAGAGVFTYVRTRQAAAAAASSASTLQTATARQGNLILKASGAGYLVAASESSVGFEDNGTGIQTDALPYIFDRFYRADSSRHQGEASGLGLAIAKSITEAHGGTISAESRPSDGTIIKVLLPLN